MSAPPAFIAFTKSVVDLTSSGFPVGKEIDDGVGETTMSIYNATEGFEII